MAQTISSNSADRPSPITKFISRLRRHTSKSKPTPKDVPQSTLPLDTRPPLLPSPLPLVLPAHQAALPNLGWTTLTFPPASASTPSPHPLQSASEALLTASRLFFAQPESEKAQWKHRLGSEEGWSAIPGEKEFITLRTLAYCPAVLREPATRYWNLMGAHLETTLSRVETSLGMHRLDEDVSGEDMRKGIKKGLTQFVGPCARMPGREEDKTATMLRLFRYEGHEAKEVAEPHADLGLLSVVVGDVPGLEVWDGARWFAVEKEVSQSGMKGASLLVGRQLERLSNGRYPAGGHRVVAYGDEKGEGEAGKRYRFSIVFVLRAHNPVMIESDELETRVTGKWVEPVHGKRAGDLYKEIRSSHFNINAAKEERARQRRDIGKAEEGGASG
ncbi:hypothetical protein G6514_006876 [Epicoccum nigrum]|nr:hypothetical protein G6514_006876 [Epicoccum nigrum]